MLPSGLLADQEDLPAPLDCALVTVIQGSHYFIGTKLSRHMREQLPIGEVARGLGIHLVGTAANRTTPARRSHSQHVHSQEPDPLLHL